MPVSFLSKEQRKNYGRFTRVPSPDDLARYFHMDEFDLGLISKKRGQSSRLGFALQLGTVRYLGTFLEDPLDVPMPVLHTLTRQLYINTIDDIQIYRSSEQRWSHATEIREQYGYVEITEPRIGLRLTRWLYALCWTGTDRPSVLFERATAWLLTQKVLLPGCTTLERYVSRLRSRVEEKVWKSLSRNITSTQQEKLEVLLEIPAGTRKSQLDCLRTGPVRISSTSLTQALLRLNSVRELGIKLPITAHMPTTHIAASAQDDALDILEAILGELFRNAVKAEKKARLRTLKDLDRASAILVDACRVLLDPGVQDGELRINLFEKISRDTLEQAVDSVSTIIRPSTNVYFKELEAKYKTVRRFLLILVEHIHFGANPSGASVVAAMEWLRVNMTLKIPQSEAPREVISKSWRSHVLRDNDTIDQCAYIFCVLKELQSKLKRRDVFVSPSWH
jgi:hypothetical protein